MRFLMLCLGVLAVPVHGRAADITVAEGRTLSFEEIERGACSLKLNGRIAAGDADRLRRMLEDLFPLAHDDLNPALCLDSPGGSLDEGVKIAEVLAAHFTATVIPAGAECLSACAVAFMGGTFGEYEYIFNMRLVHPAARLGFHAPALDIAEGNYDSASVRRAFDIAVDAIARIAGTLDHSHLATPVNRFPRSLLAEMLVHRGEDFLWIDTVEEAGAWDIWLITEAQPTFDNQSLTRTCMAAMRWMSDAPRTEFAQNDNALTGALGSVTDIQDGWRVQYGGLFTTVCEVRRRRGGMLTVRIVLEGAEKGEMPLRPFMAFPPDMALHVLQ